MIRIFTSLLLLLPAILLIGQTEKFNYLKIGLTSESNDIAELMKRNYEKEFYYNESSTVFLKKVDNDIELQFYDATKNLTKILLLVDNKVYVWEEPMLIDETFNELSEDEKKEVMNFYSIYRDDHKIIEGFDCFKVVMKHPEDTDGNNAIEMYVSEKLPNLPNYYPLSNKILSAEPLELTVYVFGVKIIFGTISHEKDINVFKHLNLSTDNAIKIDHIKYNEIKL